MEKPNFFRVLSVVAATVLAVAVLALVISSVFATKTYAAETKVIPSTADTKIAENASDTNYGSDTSIGADGDDPNGTGKDKSALIKWDLSAIAPGTQVNSASITLNVTNSSTNTYQAYKLKQPWSESTATWNVSSSGSPWQVAGAQGALDRDTTVAGTISPLVTGNQTLSITPTVVQGWVDDPTSNQGIIFANTTNTDGLDLYSRESTTASQRPTLTLGLGTDTTPPETTIDSGPSGTFSNTSASFTFSSSELNSTFECRLDGAAFSSCTSPKSYDSLSDGSHTFEVRATDAAGNTDATPASRTWTVDSTSAQNDPVLVGAGDIASCASSGDEATAKLLDSISGSVFTIGDNAYESGTDAEFKNCYDPSWGRHKARTKPSVGNHEYVTAGASGYFNYFGTAAGDPTKGYYSYDSGQWHIVALNAMCENVGGCDSSSPQITWLKSDLAAHPTTCTLAYWHHPVFSSGSGHGNDPKMQPAWDALYAAGADVVLNGHDHDYERFAPQTSQGVADPQKGIREFVVGTGGRSHPGGWGTIQPNSEVRNSDTYGVLKLTLHSGSYDWQFVPEAGKSFADSGSGQCHGAPGDTDTTPPTVSSVVPAGGATDVAPATNVEATFSENMDASTLTTSTFTLVKQSITTPVTAAVSYDSAAKKATLDPSADLDPNATYTATVKGGSSGAKDAAGNPLASDKAWSFTTAASFADTTPPDTTIASGPTGTVTSGSASFSFSSTEPGSRFECSLDNAAFSSCISPKTYTGLADGSHTFEVRATDAAGNADATPASRTWTIDATAPTVSGVAPTDGATDVAPNTNVTASFSEDMDSSTLSSSTFTLAPVDSSGNVGQPITAMVTYDSATKKATLDPSADLNPGTKYTATVTTGAKDKAGNPLVSAKVWSFTTAQIAAPSGLQATRSGNPNRQSINLTWTDNSSNEDNFTVERCTGSSSYCAINGNWQVLTSTLAANTTSYAENSVSRGTTYWYRVKATKGTLSSGYSNVASAITK